MQLCHFQVCFKCISIFIYFAFLWSFLTVHAQYAFNINELKHLHQCLMDYFRLDANLNAFVCLYIVASSPTPASTENNRCSLDLCDLVKN